MKIVFYVEKNEGSPPKGGRAKNRLCPQGRKSDRTVIGKLPYLSIGSAANASRIQSLTLSPWSC